MEGGETATTLIKIPSSAGRYLKPRTEWSNVYITKDLGHVEDFIKARVQLMVRLVYWKDLLCSLFRLD